MDTFSLEFIGWFYTIGCAIAVAVGIAVMLHLHYSGRLKLRYKDYSIWNDIMITIIWVIGLAGGVGVLDLNQWGHFLLQLFCSMLIALVCTSGATRLFALYRMREKLGITDRDLMHSMVGVTLAIVPVVLFCAATIMSLRTEEARRAFGIH